MKAETSKQANTFPHDSNARNDEKLVRLRMRHGAAGYGVYFMLLERMRDEADYMSVRDYNMLAYDLRVDASLVKSVIEEFGLFVFTEDGKYFYSDSFKRRMDMADASFVRRSAAGRKAANARHAKEKQARLEALPEPNFNLTPSQEEVANALPGLEEEHDNIFEVDPVKTQPPFDYADNNECYHQFFCKENAPDIDILLMNFGLMPKDVPILQNLAKEVINEWTLSKKQHYGYSDWACHLISCMRTKNRIRRQQLSNNSKIPASQMVAVKPSEEEYTSDISFGSVDK